MLRPPKRKKLLKSPRLIKYNNDGKNTWMFPKLYFIMKALHIRAVISNGHYANEFIPSQTHWEIGNMRHNNNNKEWKFGYGIYQKYIFHFFLLWWGVDPRWCYICQLHDSAVNPTNLLITHNWFHITHQFSLVRLSSVRLSLRWALQKRPMKAKSPDLKISFCFSLFSSLFLFRFRCLVALGSESDL